jgi:A/G-specific adenine glycosylase
MQKKKFTQKIIEWYHDNKRLLPWRDTSDPYKIWLSEIILQQTRVAQGLPYYLKFIARFPDVVKLSRAGEQEVLRLWQGLGYYTRARNLHRCAKMVAEQYHARFPETFQELQKLPGIGPYTAAAIASISFKEPVAVVDGNVYRVLARHFGIEQDIGLPETKKYFFDLANILIDRDHPDDFNQAIMEFGALHCTPQNPKCMECVLKNSCKAYATDEQMLLPVKRKAIKIRKRYLYYLVIRKNKKLVLQKRMGKDIWQGLYDFYAIETARPYNPLKILEQSGLLEKWTSKIEIGRPSPVYKHILSHQTLSARFIPIFLTSKETIPPRWLGKKIRFYSAREVHLLPKPVLVSKHLQEIGFL